MGEHACESVDVIFRRKIDDISRIGKTFWLLKSRKAQPAKVKKLCTTLTTYAIFIVPATKGGARPTTIEDVAKEYSNYEKLWY